MPVRELKGGQLAFLMSAKAPWRRSSKVVKLERL